MATSSTRRLRIIVKAFPQPSKKYEETVCCAGITEDTGELVRLFPIRYRRLEKKNQFDRFDLVEMTMTKASDPRPESYQVNEPSIRVIEKGHKLSDHAKVQLWRPHIAESLTALLDENRATQRSLGIIKPHSLQFEMKAARESEEADQQVASQVFQQQSFLEDTLAPIEPPSHSFAYRFTSGDKSHRHQVHDWEVQAAFRAYKRRYGGEESALRMMHNEYQSRIPEHNLHFIMGTMAAHPKTFIVIGLLRSSLDPEEIAKQPGLFEAL